MSSYPDGVAFVLLSKQAGQQKWQLEDEFIADERVLLVLEGLATQMSGPEIKQDLGINQNELETAMTRLRRGAANADEEN